MPPIVIIAVIFWLFMMKKPAQAQKPQQQQSTKPPPWWQDAFRFGGSAADAIKGVSSAVTAMAPSAQAFIGLFGERNGNNVATTGGGMSSDYVPGDGDFSVSESEAAFSSSDDNGSTYFS